MAEGVNDKIQRLTQEKFDQYWGANKNRGQHRFFSQRFNFEDTLLIEEDGYFADDEDLYRLYVCEQCHKYIKTIDLRHTESEILLPLERVLTLDMDRQAQEKGYKPGQSNA